MTRIVITGGTVVDGTGAAPRAADVQIDDDKITAVDSPGSIDTSDARVIDATGCIVSPGWVDVHTHYDGQATWDGELAPSSWHGVTTIVMGNCGVGFAPVRPDGTDFLIELMESVEDIPGTALHEGIDWTWEHFSEYLDTLDSMPRTMDVAAQVPHAAVRAYVMGDRAHEDQPTNEEIAEIRNLVHDAIEAGAVGFSTSRTILHSSRHGLIPGTGAPADELLEIAKGMADVGRGVFQFIADGHDTEAERAWIHQIAEDIGLTLTYTLAQSPLAPHGFTEALDDASALAAKGHRVLPQVSPRPTGMLFGLTSSFHPFMAHPAYRDLWGKPLEERVAALRDPEFAAALFDEAPETKSVSASYLAQNWGSMYLLGDPPDYEPHPDTSVAATAAREGRRPQEVALEWLLQDDGQALFFSPLASYVDGDHEAIREMMEHPASILGLSDGGAHCGLICDASFPTYLLTHWARDRTRGAKLPIELLVHKQTQATAEAYGFADRGVLAPGMRADVNVIDLDNLTLHSPEMRFDLPAGGRRLVQRVDGYKTTLVAGEVTFIDGEPTGARPGRLVRSTA